MRQAGRAVLAESGRKPGGAVLRLSCIMWGWCVARIVELPLLRFTPPQFLLTVLKAPGQRCNAWSMLMLRDLAQGSGSQDAKRIAESTLQCRVDATVPGQCCYAGTKL